MITEQMRRDSVRFGHGLRYEALLNDARYYDKDGALAKALEREIDDFDSGVEDDDVDGW